MPFIQAAATTGPAEYPPTPRTRSGLKSFRSPAEAARLMGSSMKAHSCFSSPRFLRPCTAMAACLKPFSFKTDVSNGLPVPIKRISLSAFLERISSATAIPGKRCPPVPPPAMTTRTGWVL